MQRGSQWSAGAREVRDAGEGDSLKMIPAWSVVLAIAFFVGSMYFFNYTPSRPAFPTAQVNNSADGVAFFDPQGIVRLIPKDEVELAMRAGGTRAVKMYDQNGIKRWVREGEVDRTLAAGGKLAQEEQPDDQATAPSAAQSSHSPGASPSAGPASSQATSLPVGQQRRSSRPPSQEAGHLLFSYSTSAALASYVLLIGYVSRDVKRRHMSAPLWMLIVLVIPGGIGAIVYFLLRQPMMMRCPHCTTELVEGVHFCPQCRFQVAPVCGQCFRGVQITDAYCPQCGHDVAEDLAPARLRVFSDS